MSAAPADPPAAGSAAPERPATVLVYSNNATVRERVRGALGERPAPDVSPLRYVEAETGLQVVERCDRGDVDLAILDGEAWPTGGLGLARQLRDELAVVPRILVLTGRRDDAWLATWSRADAAVPHPIDAVRLAGAVAELLRCPAGAPA
jgi:DNA-binding response OmpR family regulator